MENIDIKFLIFALPYVAVAAHCLDNFYNCFMSPDIFNSKQRWIALECSLCGPALEVAIVSHSEDLLHNQSMHLFLN